MPAVKVIVNPAAGKGAGRRQAKEIRARLAANGIDGDLAFTEGSGHAIEMAREASLAGCKVVVAAGGDGTTNEVINGLMGAKEKGGGAALGVIGLGTGNDFTYAARIPEDLDGACRCLAQGHRRWMDIAHVKGGDWPCGRYVGNGVGVGFDVKATVEVRKIKRLTGTPAFVLAALKTLFLCFDAPMITVQTDDRTVTGRFLMISIMNGRRLGGGFYVTPEALPDDGMFDLTLAMQTTRLTILRLMAMYMRGTQLSHPSVSGMRAHRIVVRAEGGLASHADGEIFITDGQYIELEMLPRQLQVVCEPEGT
jgi:YegS/Rv2252/BmrU family lipid kinase